MNNLTAIEICVILALGLMSRGGFAILKMTPNWHFRTAGNNEDLPARFVRGDQ